MGLLGGFKGKLIGKKKEKNNQVVCVTYTTFSEFDAPSGVGASTSWNGAVKEPKKPDVEESVAPQPQIVEVPATPTTDEISGKKDGVLKTTDGKIRPGFEDIPARDVPDVGNVFGNGTTGQGSATPKVPPRSVVPQIVEVPTDGIPVVTSGKTDVEHVVLKTSEGTRAQTEVEPVKASGDTRSKTNVEPVVLKASEDAKAGIEPGVSKSPEAYEMKPMVYSSSLKFPLPIESDDDDDDDGNFTIHLAQNHNIQDDDSPSEEESEAESEEELTHMDYSSQAASIFFGDDEEEPQVMRPRNVNCKDDDDSDGSSASA